MPSAICPHCQEPAFSSAQFDRPWTCPTCGEVVIPPDFRESERSIRQIKNPTIELYTKFWTKD